MWIWELNINPLSLTPFSVLPILLCNVLIYLLFALQPHFKIVISSSNASSAVIFLLLGVLLKVADLLVHHLPVLVEALLAAVDLGPAPGAPVHLLTSAEALVTVEGAGPFRAECIKKKLILTKIAAYHLSAASLIPAADIATT